MATRGVWLGQYNYPSNDCTEFWYMCSSWRCRNYLLFERRVWSAQEIDRALKYACEQNAMGVTVTKMKENTESSHFNTRLVFSVGQFKEHQPRFNSDVACVVNYEELIPCPNGNRPTNVQLVMFQMSPLHTIYDGTKRRTWIRNWGRTLSKNWKVVKASQRFGG